MSHNAEIKLCHLYQFAEAFSGIASYKIFCPSFMLHHFTKNCIWLKLFLPAWDTRRGEEFSERGPNSFKRCPTHFTGGGSGEAQPPALLPLVTCLSMNVKLGTFEAFLAS